MSSYRFRIMDFYNYEQRRTTQPTYWPPAIDMITCEQNFNN